MTRFLGWGGRERSGGGATCTTDRVGAAISPSTKAAFFRTHLACMQLRWRERVVSGRVLMCVCVFE